MSDTPQVHQAISHEWYEHSSLPACRARAEFNSILWKDVCHDDPCDCDYESLYKCSHCGILVKEMNNEPCYYKTIHDPDEVTKIEELEERISTLEEERNNQTELIEVLEEKLNMLEEKLDRVLERLDDDKK